MEVTAPFLIDAQLSEDDFWVGRVRVDGHVLFLCAEAVDREAALSEARASLASHLQMLFAGATDLARQQQTERYDSLVELEAARVLREAAGWTLALARFDGGKTIAVYQRAWGQRDA